MCLIETADDRLHPDGLPLSGGPVSVLVHDGSRRHCRGRRRGRSCALRWPFDGWRSRWSVAQRRVGPCRVVMDPPRLDHDARLGEGVEDLAVQKLVAELRVEALTIPVLPRAPRFDERRLRADRRNPVPDRLGDELIRASPSSLSDRTWPGTPREAGRDRSGHRSPRSSSASDRSRWPGIPW